MASKGSKWAKIKEQYPKLPLDAEYAQKIEAVLNSPVPGCDAIEAGLTDQWVKDDPLRTYSIDALVAIYNAWRGDKERLEDELSGVNLKLEAVERMIEEYYDANGLLTQKFDDGTSITVSPDPVVNVEDSQAFYAWVKEDAERVSKFKLAEYINPQTAKAGVKAMLEQNLHTLPPGVKVYYQNKLSRRTS